MATESDNMNAGAVGTMIAVLALGVLATSLALTALVRGESDADAMANAPASELLAARQSQVDELNQPAAWVDKAEGHVSVPVAQAMESTAAGLKADPQSATPYPPEKPDAGTDGGDAGADAQAESEDAGSAAPDAAAPGAPAPEAPTPRAPAPEAPTPRAPAPEPPAPPPTDDTP